MHVVIVFFFSGRVCVFVFVFCFLFLLACDARQTRRCRRRRHLHQPMTKRRCKSGDRRFAKARKHQRRFRRVCAVRPRRLKNQSRASSKLRAIDLRFVAARRRRFVCSRTVLGTVSQLYHRDQYCTFLPRRRSFVLFVDLGWFRLTVCLRRILLAVALCVLHLCDVGRGRATAVERVYCGVWLLCTALCKSAGVCVHH